MDPKLSNLDPKLQDAYHRVMGTTPAGNPPQPQNATPPPPVPQAPSAFTQQPAPQAAPPPPPPPAEPAFVPPPVPLAQEVQAPPPAPDPIPSTPSAPIPSNLPPGSIPGVNSTMAFNAEDSHKNVGTTPVKKGGLHIMPVIIGMGILMLLVVYTFVWIILFNVQVPFLPQL